LEAIKKEERFYYTSWTKWSDPAYTAKLEAAEKAVEVAKAARELADKDWSDIEETLKSSPTGQELARLQVQIDQRRGEIESLRETAKNYLNQVADSPLQRVKLKAMEVLPTALTVLAGIILVPIAIKAFLYWCVAPFVGKPLTRDGVEYLLSKHAITARKACSSLKNKRVSPHVLRHSTAMSMLEGGVDCSVISSTRPPKSSSTATSHSGAAAMEPTANYPSPSAPASTANSSSSPAAMPR
jgi:hypothetical protein